MGIKHFFYWFKNNLGKNIKNIKRGENLKNVDVSIDNLMIDLNGLFHDSTQKYYEYGKYKPQPRLSGKPIRRKKIGGLKTQIKVFEDVCKNIDNLFYKSNPSKRLILCVDGPAPLSKQNQQRQRRFRSAAEKEDEEFKRFDSNAITPGTKFMDYLTKYIDWHIRKSISENERWKDIDVVFSNEKVPGEGEHKIINYIRKYGNKEDTFCIHGLDADLIMLALGTHLPNFWILREDLYGENDFFLIDIGKTRIELSKMLDWNDGEIVKNVTDDLKFNPEYAINDFIFMCFMVGNDFLPHVPSLEIIEGGIDQMIDVYKNVGEHYGHLTQNKNDNIMFRHKSLKIFFGTISGYDKGVLENKLLHKDTFFRDEILENNAEFNSKKYNVNMESYRKEYYEKCFTNDNMTSIKDLCHQYFVGLHWVLSYYTRGVPDWKWCFKHHYAPFAHELSEHIDTFTFESRRNTIPTTPFQQLLSVLPPQSAGLIPMPLSGLLTDSSSKIKKYCPLDFKVDLSGKRKEWEGIVLLPMVDFEIIREEYFKYIDKVDSRELRRNISGTSWLYTYSKYSSFFSKSFYGDIPQCRIIRKEITL